MAGYGMYLLQTTLALVGVSALAIVALRLLRRVPSTPRGLRVVARLPLEPRRTLYVVEAAGKLLLVGVGDGPMTTLAELDPARASELEPESTPTATLEIVRRALGRGAAR